MQTKINVENTTISARVIRADGSIEDLGIICSTKKKTLVQKIISKFKGVK